MTGLTTQTRNEKSRTGRNIRQPGFSRRYLREERDWRQFEAHWAKASKRLSALLDDKHPDSGEPLHKVDYSSLHPGELVVLWIIYCVQDYVPHMYVPVSKFLDFYSTIVDVN